MWTRSKPLVDAVRGAHGGAAAPRVLNVGLEINPLRGSTDAAADDADDEDGVARWGCTSWIQFHP
jgi:hypothetical protein